MPEYDLSGTVAFVTGAARAQGRSHAVQYAEHGADVVVTDICENIETNPYDLGTRNQLEETASMVEDAGGESLLVEMLDTNLKGVWLCSKHVGKHFVDRGDGGKIVSTTSGLGMHGAYSCGHYGAAKWGVRGLTKTLALELADYDVNVNCVAPTVVDTPMIDGFVEAYGEEILEEMGALSGPVNIFHPEDGGIEPEDITEAYMWLSSDAARYVTGITLPVDAGYSAK